MTHAKYRNNLPQLNGVPLVTDGGLETWLLFDEGFDLPLFAAFPLLDSAAGREALDRYMSGFCDIAAAAGKGMVLDTPTWRASKRWADELGVGATELRALHRTAIERLVELRGNREPLGHPFVVNGAIGPADDGYNPSGFMDSGEAERYHSQQVNWFAEFGADMVSAITMTYVEEAIGIARAAAFAGIPSAISFTVETDGRLPSGQSLRDAIEQVERETDGAPAYYMINCAHPDHFAHVLEEPGAWRRRIMGIRANASRMSHEELDNSETLDSGDPAELGTQYRDLMNLLPNLMVLGGCCGTDHRHVEAIHSACGHAHAA